MKARANRTKPPIGRIDYVPAKDLLFDATNPRLAEGEQPATQRAILETWWRECAVDEVALSIAANGYFPHEPLFASKEQGRLVVIEGNRRLAAVRLLVDTELRRLVGATDLPTIKPSAKKGLEHLPVVVCDRPAIWQYVGFKHVNGPQQWQSYSKAQYIAWVHNTLGEPLEAIARQIGDQHSTVERLYRASMVLEQAEKAAVFDRNDRAKKHFSFSHLYTGLDYPGIQKLLGLSKGKDFSIRSPVPKSKLANLGEFCEWLYGSKSKQLKPVITSQNPDLRILNEVVLSKNGTAALRRGLPLSVARDIGKGDPQLFREALIAAKQSLQESRGKLLTGYAGETDLLATARDILGLAESIHEEMMRSRTGKGRKARGTQA